MYGRRSRVERSGYGVGSAAAGRRMRDESLHGTVAVADDVGVGRNADGRAGV